MLDLLRAPVAQAIAQHLDLDLAEVMPLVIPPTKAGAGDLAVPCFALAKARKVAPPRLASELADTLASTIPGAQASAAGPFLNISFSPATVAGMLLPALADNPCVALRDDSGAGHSVCIDFSSPNIAKHLAFHHIRSTMIGNSLARIYQACGWDVARINFLGDWGTAFGRLIAGWKRENLSLSDLEAADDKVTFLNALYVRISTAAEADASVAEEARTWSKRLEDGDTEARELWQVFKDASLTEFHKVYGLLGVDFDSWKGEAYYEDKMAPVLAELESSGLLSKDDGASVVDLSAEGFKKPVLIKRADGGTLYATRDLAACQDRFNEFNFDRSMYVVDLGQGLHFGVGFAVAKKLDKPYADRLRHVGFGVVLMWDETEQAFLKGSSKKGRVLLLTDVLNESITRARAIVAEKNPELSDDEQNAVAHAVGIGAVVFNDLKNGRKGDVKFRYEDALNMQGDTGVYLQFAHARLCSIERRFASTCADAPAGDVQLLTRDDEKNVLLLIARMRDALRLTLDNDEPSQLAQALLQLAAGISSWLSAGSKDHSARVIGDDLAVSAARIRLVAAARATLGEGLRLLGLIAPERM
ncbi:MAG: arginine--tRNA ligase [Planctomycetota bacterium]|jgi:arginyl-tRNA synthetase|nr:arginine--tRNA ligase [Planctomycetota bacterium]